MSCPFSSAVLRNGLFKFETLSFSSERFVFQISGQNANKAAQKIEHSRADKIGG
jgi:hypothetical protein